MINGINALGVNSILYSQPDLNRVNQNPITSTISFDDVLGSAMNKNDVTKTLGSFGVSVNVRNTPKQVSSFSELSSGLTIAPNIIMKMSQDEEYFREITDEIFNWFLIEVPACERQLAPGYKVVAGMSIDEDGEIVRWSGVFAKADHQNSGDEDVIWEVANSKKAVSNAAVHFNSLTSSHDVDVSTFLALVGNLNFEAQRRRD